MKIFSILALAASASALVVERGDNKCCFTLEASGGVSGTVGQLDDGQNRVGGHHPPGHYCLSNSGGLTDNKGRGCILTPPTTQLQCDKGASPTTGFSVNSEGQLEYHGNTRFVACKVDGEYNIYTNPPKDSVTGCKDITLMADGCAPKTTKTCDVTKTKTVDVTNTKTVEMTDHQTAAVTKTNTVDVTVTHIAETCAPTTHPAPPPTHPTTTMQPTTTKPQPTSSSCPTDLSGNYEFPHLMVPIDSSHPNKAAGTSYFGTVSDTVSTIFDFDIPAKDSGKTCSLIFLFPKQSDLQTSSYTFKGDGKIDVAKLKSPATDKTTYDNAPGVAQDYGTTTIAPGSSYLIATFDCPANQRIGFEVSNAGSTDLHYFQDYNPSPIGLYITTC